jgi:hypothetical protein
MKLSRDDLKNIVKECLVEILSEGLVGASQQINERRTYESHEKVPTKQQSYQNPRATVADKISFLPKAQNAPKQESPKVNKSAIKAATSDPLLQEMLADTALRGTPIVEDSRRGPTHEVMIASQGDAAAKAMLRSDPEDVFGDSASKWAVLAFSEKKISA